MKRRVRFSGKAALYFAATLASLPSAVSADTSIVQQIKHNGAALTESHMRTLEVKGLKMRVESRNGAETHASIYDLEAGKRYRLDPKHKEGEDAFQIPSDWKAMKDSQSAAGAIRILG